METKDKIPGTTEAWESGELGQDERYVEVDSQDDLLIDEALELKMISIRLQKGLIDDLKFVADINGMSYQPLIRQILQRFVNAEMKMLARSLAAQKIECEESEQEEAERNCA